MTSRGGLAALSQLVGESPTYGKRTMRTLRKYVPMYCARCLKRVNWKHISEQTGCEFCGHNTFHRGGGR